MNLGQGILLALIPTTTGLVPYWDQATLGESIMGDATHFRIVSAEGKVRVTFPKAHVVAVLLLRGQGYVLHKTVSLG